MQTYSISKIKRGHRFLAIFFLVIFVPTLIPVSAYAANNGPNAPEAASFEPVDASDMVSLATGDMAYVLPLLDVPSPEGGYPVSLAYHAAVGFDQEASWVGLGWNLNPGAINRNVNGVPDDWKDAVIRDREHFESWGRSTSLSVGWGQSQSIDIGVGYSWDSFGTKRGSLSVGVSRQSGNSSSIGGEVGVGYSNKDGWDAQVGVSANVNGVGLAVSASTTGVYSISAGYSGKVGQRGGNDVKGFASVGISIVSDRGSVGAFAGGMGTTLYSSKSASNASNGWGCGAAFYLYGFYVRLGYQYSSYKYNKLDENHVYGPLYFKSLSSNPQPETGHVSYSNNDFANEHNRNWYMDTYSQPVPEIPSAVVAEDDVFKSQKIAYNAPAYDSYEVSAQGLSGRMSPRLLDDGLLVNSGVDYEYLEEDLHEECVRECGPAYPQLECHSEPQFRGMKKRTNWIYANSHYSNLAGHKFNYDFDEANSKLFFYFDQQFPSTLAVNPTAMAPNGDGHSLEHFLSSSTAAITTRKENSDFIEAFTNSQVLTLINQAGVLEAKGYNRANDPGYTPEGIGGYRITTADGKTYHYMRPVYHFEEFYRSLAQKSPTETYDENQYYREVRKMKPYATHWLLTAITGPDYVKMSNNSYPSEGDYGYWVRFDYGKWTDGYVWRSPYDGYLDRSNNSSVKRKEYAWGRKQLVYLDKIVTRTHTALFVKSLRQDDLGKDIGANGFKSYEGDDVEYKSQQPLKLDEIILVKNENDAVETYTQHSPLTNGPAYNDLHWNSQPSGQRDFHYLMNQQQDVLDKNDFEIDHDTGEYAIYSSALKIIKLGQSYDLAQYSPNSTAPTRGRLTLESVNVLGKGGQSVLPPFWFEYIGKNVPYFTCEEDSDCYKDSWGYGKENPQAWTMNKIHTPTGSTVEIEYEQDTYYTEAFSRRLFAENDLKFRAITDTDGEKVVEFMQADDYQGDPILFEQYFSPENPTWMSLWVCKSEADGGGPGSIGDKDWMYWKGFIPIPIKSVTSDVLTVRLPQNPDPGPNRNYDYGTFDYATHTTFRQVGGWHCSVGTECAEGNDSRYVFNFKVLSNLSPAEGSGGGLRVKRISVHDENGGKLTTRYDYNHPTLGRTSGITSYAPSRDVKYVAYQSEIPGPRVLYEYVRLTEEDADGNTTGGTLYQFNTLKPVVNVFDRNMKSGEHFKATVNVQNLSSEAEGAQVNLEDNFATVGSLVQQTMFNEAGQIIHKATNHVYSLEQLASPAIEKPGSLKESFHSMKSIYHYNRTWIKGGHSFGVANWQDACFLDDDLDLYKRVANTSSKTLYPSVVPKTEIVTPSMKQITEYKNVDPKTGYFLETHTKTSDGRLLRAKVVPAYTKYAQMGSKVDNPTNKHMLKQEAMSVVSLANSDNPNDGWKTLDARLTTWKKEWLYPGNTPTGLEPISLAGKPVWRKHQIYAWKDRANHDGTYVSSITAETTHFDWATNQPLSENWQRLAEIRRYTHWSVPLETIDINGNSASSRMADRSSKTIVSGNTRYSEMYYTGAEYVDELSPQWYDGEIQGAHYRTSEVAHTGKYSMQPKEPGDILIDISGEVGTADIYRPANYDRPFRPGRYKISFWAYRDGRPDIYALLKLNGQPIPVSETVNAGCWQLRNYYVRLEPLSNVNVTLSVTGLHSRAFYDDFRMHPVAASINSYVYDNETDMVETTLDANNMGTTYKYDAAGKVVATYVERPDVAGADGGFRLLSQSAMHYKNDLNMNAPVLSKLNNCVPQQYDPLKLNLEMKCAGTFASKFHASAIGGSGSYSYQWKWLVNEASNTFNSYVNGPDTYYVPYAAKYCDPSHFDKKWHAVVKVTDLVTGQTATSDYSYITGNCDNEIDGRDFASLEINKCYGYCAPELLTFRIHLSDPAMPGNFKYEYASYTSGPPFDPNTLNWIDVTDTQGMFCPTYMQVPDNSCEPSGIRNVAYFVYRITNLTTGVVDTSPMMEFVGSCQDVLYIQSPFNPIPAYLQQGLLIAKDYNGTVINVIDTNR